MGKSPYSVLAFELFSDVLDRSELQADLQVSLIRIQWSEHRC